eukprot:CAMPEP_0172556356 /NCGR_PEP_ID=MMETSP1067-20121228/65688_1 /TAXON_ID=265564 ORGANISM="Thalassiosira punctigera, Strain Tpunct2005C2" /NCGR_SAMPLE_ID=MMETSP1067 /ASSEMBLY_ACC=CAM_ASM_000444 /LENGTH=79 /DNA_ID=CAMNT_0013345149 /DNA_START=31 /DNA_END=270 /DNA_ORIENTATION=+
MAAAYAFLIAISSQKNPDGTRRKLPKVNLDDSVDLNRAWEELKGMANSVRRGEAPSFPEGASRGAHDGSDGNGENGATK